MKTIGLLLILFLCFGCEEQPLVEQFDEDPPQTILTEVVPLAVANNRLLPPNDPNLNSDWDWEDSSWKISFLNSEGQIGSFDAVNPFYSTNPIFGNGDPNQVDMREKDGWKLVARDFGTPTDAPIYPWIMLYNQYRGLLRVCLLNTRNSETGYLNLSLSFGLSDSAPALFDFTEGASQSAVVNAIPFEWMVAEFNLQGYDPSIDTQARLHLGIHDVSISKMFNGQLLQVQMRASGVLTSPYLVESYSFKLWDQIPEIGNDRFMSRTQNINQDAHSLTAHTGGLIQNLTSSGNYPNTSITLESDSRLEGIIELGSPRGGIEVYLSPNANNKGYPKALNPISWGVMNYNEVEVAANQAPGSFLLINPAISESIATIEAGWIRPDQPGVTFVPLTVFESSLVDNPVTAIAVRITFENGDVVYNRVPVK